MATLTYRLVKGSELTYSELDGNFSTLNTAKLELGQAQASGVANALVYLNASKQPATSAGLTFDGANLGIGTASPGSKLDVYGGAAGTVTNAQVGNASTAFVFGVDASNNCQVRTAQSVNMLFYTAATERMRLDPTGNLTIGGTNSSARLRVEGTTNLTTALQLFRSGNACSALWTEASALRFGVDGSTGFTERMVLDFVGNLGVGVAPSAWSVIKALQLSSRGAAFYADPGSADSGLVQNAFYGASGWTYIATNQAAMYNQSGAVHTWWSAGTGTAGTAVTFINRMQLDAAGNLGLGQVPSAWVGGAPAIELFRGALGSMGGGPVNHSFMSANLYGTGSTDPAFTTWRYKVGGVAQLLELGGAYAFSIKTAGSGTAGAAATLTQALTLDGSGNLLVGILTSNATRLTVAGPVALQSPSSVNAATYTVAVADSALRFTTTNCTITLPAAASFPGRIIWLSNITANSVASASSNVVPLGSATAGTAILAATAGKFAVLQSDGTNWLTILAN